MTVSDKINEFSLFMIFKFLPIFILFIVLILLLDRKISKKKVKSTLQKEKQENAHGIIFGKQKEKVIFSPTNDEGHIIALGGSGLGKTSALLIPTLRSWTGTSFVIDISGDICKNVQMDHKMIYEPANPNSTPYNIFGAIDLLNDEDDQNEALEELAFLLMPDEIKMADTAKFFNTEGRKILTASLISFYHQGLDFIPICEKIVRSSWVELFNEIYETDYSKALQYVKSFEGTSEQNTAGCKQSVDAVLKLFATNERIKKTIRRSDQTCFTPSVLEKWNVFVIIDDSKLKLYASILHIITAQNLAFFSSRSNDSKTTILFCLDEFASMGKLEITEALRKLRKKHIRIFPLTQSMADIDLIYGYDERKAMMNNFRYKAILGADDTDTQEYLAKLIGHQSTQRHSTTSSDNHTTRTESEAKDWIIEPAELARLGDNIILLHPNGHMKLKKNPYYQ